MKNIKNKIKIIIVSLTALFILPQYVGAFSIAPQVIEFRTTPGEIKEFKIKIKNDEKTDLCFKLEIEAISKMNQNGSPVFGTITDSLAIAPWFSLKEKSICAKSGEVINPTLVIQIPNTVRTAGIYATAYLTPTFTTQNNQGPTVINRIGTLIAIRLDQIISVEQGNIAQFGYDKTNKKFLIDFKNDGTIHLRPYGEIVIKTEAGRIVDTLPFNETGGLVLPDSNRYFEILWDKRLYENSLATLQILYGTGPKMTSATTALKAQTQKNEMNSRLMVIALLVIGVIVLRLVIKKIRRNNY